MQSILDFLWGIDSPLHLLKSAKNAYHFLVAHAGAAIYRHPSRSLFVIGVTGTKGKTSTVELINAGLEAAGHRTAINSSLRRKIGDESRWNRQNSMPGRFYLQNFLREAKKDGCEFAIIEVTSEGVVQSRHRGISFDAAIFTGLHREHIESHGSFEKYRKAKLNFFEYVKNKSHKIPKLFFINIEDENARHFIEAARNGKNEDSKIFLFLKSQTPSNLAGDFNKLNIGAAESFLTAIGVPQETIKRAFSNFKGVPGRMEQVLERPFKVYVDYAHTPDSLESVYKSLKNDEENDAAKLICVLGSAGGGRDKWKRPQFGEIAANYCDKIILTDEDPYDEDPTKIIKEIKSGIPVNYPILSNVHALLDRREAIKHAISLAKEGDTVILTGKGSERSIHAAKGKIIPWSDREVALEVLKEAKVI